MLQPERLGDEVFRTELDAAAPDLAVVAAYGRLLPQWLLDQPRHGTVNVHASLLPKWRGAAPVHRAIMAGDTKTGVTIIRLVKAMDAGPMLARCTRPIGPDEASAAVEAALAELGAELVVTAIDRIGAGTQVEEEQDHAAATFAPRLTRDDAPIDWRRSARAIHNHVRGLHPWPHASAVLDGKRYLIHRTAVVATAGEARTPGTVTETQGDQLVVAAGEGSRLAIREIQPEGRKRLPARAFLTGHRWRSGMRFET